MSILAVDLGGSHAACALVSGTQILASETVPVTGRETFESVVSRLTSAMKQQLASAPTKSEPCRGIGFGFCGLVDSTRGRILSTSGKYADALGFDLVAWAQTEFNLPLRLENDARTALLGEWYAGAGRGSNDIVMMTLGTGVGGAAMIDGKLLRGKHFQAGCLGGHLGVNHKGRACSCGNIGCVEAEASSWSLPAICAAHPLFHQSPLAALPGISFEALFRIATHGDACALEVRDACIQVWAAGAVSMIHAYDPEVLIVGGGIMNSGAEILPAMSEYIDGHAWTPWGKVMTRAATLKDRAALIGAVPLFETELQ
jgi:glucokinase